MLHFSTFSKITLLFTIAVSRIVIDFESWVCMLMFVKDHLMNV